MNNFKLFLFVFISFWFSYLDYAQPQKGSFGIGGSGFWVSIKPRKKKNNVQLN